MKIKETPLKDCYIIEPTIFEDDRGYFYEKFNEQKFEELTGMNGHFVQDNISKSSYGVLRGIHLQKGEHAQAKLVSCLEGKVFDVAVDLRADSPTFLQWHAVELSEENNKAVFIPEGFAHGFQSLSDDACLLYMHTKPWDKSKEFGVRYDDPLISIDWPLPIQYYSERDAEHPKLDPNFKGLLL